MHAAVHGVFAIEHSRRLKCPFPRTPLLTTARSRGFRHSMIRIVSTVALHCGEFDRSAIAFGHWLDLLILWHGQQLTSCDLSSRSHVQFGSWRLSGRRPKLFNSCSVTYALHSR